MITSIQPYSIKQSNYKPSFNAVIGKNTYIPVKRRGEVIPENIIPKFFAQIKEIFYEIFPGLDPQYKQVFKNL